MNRSIVLLLVEDDPVLGPLTADILADRGHRATLAPTMAEAFRHMHPQHVFEMILLDLELGDERGEDLIDRLRELSIAMPHIVIFSAQPESELHRAAERVGIEYVLRKPCTRQALLETIERVA